MLILDRITAQLQTTIPKTLGYPVIPFIVDSDYFDSRILAEIDGIFRILTVEHLRRRNLLGRTYFRPDGMLPYSAESELDATGTQGGCTRREYMIA